MNWRDKVYPSRLWEMTRSEWKLRQQSSWGGFLWTLLEPLLTYLVLYWLFTQWMQSNVEDYAAHLLIGVVSYGFFSAATAYGMTSPRRRRGIMMNFIVERELLVVSASLSVALSYLLEVALMTAVIAALGSAPTILWLFLPLFAGLFILLVTGLALHLSVLAARFSDFERIWRIVLFAGYFLTPVFYTLDALSESRRAFLRFNPLAHIIELIRDSLVRGRTPPLDDIAGLSVLCVVVFASGYFFFKAHEKKLSDYVLH